MVMAAVALHLSIVYIGLVVLRSHIVLNHCHSTSCPR